MIDQGQTGPGQKGGKWKAVGSGGSHVAHSTVG